MFREHENGGSSPSSETFAVRYANRQSGPFERRTFVGSTPTLTTPRPALRSEDCASRLNKMVPWSSGNDGWFTSSQRWFESIRDHSWGSGPMGRRSPRTREIGVRLPGAPLFPLTPTPLPRGGGEGISGLMVQRDDAGLAGRRSGFDSR